MKKLIAIILALVLITSLSVTVFAADTQVGPDGDSETGSTMVEYSVAPDYTVTIPADVKVEFNALSTSFGSIKLEQAQIDFGYAVKVELNASEELKNTEDTSKSIVYSINANGSAFNAATYTTVGEETVLTIDITQSAWDAAFAGSYSDTVTFIVSYVDTAAS